MDRLEIKDIEFLKRLSQDFIEDNERHYSNGCYYSIQEKKRRYNIKLINPDGRAIIYNMNGGLFEYKFELIEDSIDDLKNFIKQLTDDDCSGIISIDELSDYIITNLNYSELWGVYEYEYYYKNSWIFLTSKEAYEHLETKRVIYENPEVQVNFLYNGSEFKELLKTIKRLSK